MVIRAARLRRYKVGLGNILRLFLRFQHPEPTWSDLLTVPSVLLLLPRLILDFCCFLFAGSLIKSQFPVFTIYAQKSCLKMRPCERAWCIDRVQGYALKDHIKRSATAMSRQDCYEMCFGETDFLCRWVNNTDLFPQTGFQCFKFPYP